MKKKLLSLALAMAMCLGLTVPASAAGTEKEFTDENIHVTVTMSGFLREETLHLSGDYEGDLTVCVVEDGSSITVEAAEGYRYATEKDRDGFYASNGDECREYEFACTRGSNKIRINVNDGGAVGAGSFPGLLMEPVTLTAESTAVTLDDGSHCILTTGSYGVFWLCESDLAKLPPSIIVGGDAPSTETPSKPAFTDVAENSPFKDAIAWAVEQKITNGTSATTFGPGNTCTHNHILTFLWRANGSPASEGANDFAKAIAWAKSKGLGDAIDGGAACTRAQTMLYLWKLAGSPETAANSTFTDVAADADYAQAVAWAVAQGITNGTGATTFSPDATCTRGQIVTFLYRNLAK